MILFPENINELKGVSKQGSFLNFNLLITGQPQMRLPPVFHDLGDTLEDLGEIFKKKESFAPGSPHRARWLPARKVPLKPYYQGFNLGGRCLSKTESYKHCIVYGPSGSGKSSLVLMNSIFSEGLPET